MAPLLSGDTMNAEQEHDDELTELLVEESSKVLILKHSIPRPIRPGEEPPDPNTLFIPIVKP